MRNYITADEFIQSIRIAFANTTCFEEPLKRVQKRYSNCGTGMLHFTSGHGRISFYEYSDGNQIPLKKSSNRVYVLARKRYLHVLIELLKSYALQHSHGETKFQSLAKAINPKFRSMIRQQEKLLDELNKLIHRYEDANLELAKIVLTPAQYKWYFEPFSQKKMTATKTYSTYHKVITRSKSECNIGNRLEDFAACYHYEEQRQVYVKPLVAELADQVREYNRKNGLPAPGKLYSYQNGVCCWNVPDVLQWMNGNGSLWKTYNSNTGKITMYNDFTMMLADDSIMSWEHEGLLEDFMYRQNAKERASLMIATGNIDRKNLIETCEAEANNVERLIDIIKRDVLPRLWY